MPGQKKRTCCSFVKVFVPQSEILVKQILCREFAADDIYMYINSQGICIHVTILLANCVHFASYLFFLNLTLILYSPFPFI